MPTILIGDQQLDLRNYQADPAIGNRMGAYIVQFNARMSPALMDLLDKELIREYGPVLADDAILCRMGTDMAKHLRATYKEIYAVAHYKPEWKLFLPTGSAGSGQPLHIVTFTAYELDVANAVRALGGTGIHHRPFARSVRVSQLDRSRLLDLAASDWIVSISELPVAETQDNAALPLMGVALNGRYGPANQGSVPDTGAGAPPPGEDAVKVTGAGQVVCVADTGLDTGRADTLHPAFRDSTLGTGYGRPGDWSDPGGHGTHVAGIAVGQEAAVEGVAPDALLAMQSIQSAFAWNSKKGYWGSQLNTTRLVEMLHEAWTTFHAGVHNNSWGGGSRYTGDSADMDTFAYQHPEMAIVVSAGNSGPNATTILAPATAKNVITVGSCGNNLTLAAAPGVQGGLKNSLPLSGDQVSGFSSRGPTKDGRIKPDVMAPGEGILSAKSTVVENVRYPHFFASRGTNELHPRYIWNNGTSMAAPGVAGAVALLREWLMDKADPARRTAHPSSALIKALLINGADRMIAKGLFFDTTWGGWGSSDQGWGRVNISNTINPRNGVQVWWEDEAVAMENGDIREYQFTVARPAQGKSPQLLKISLVWRDPEGDVDPSDTGASATSPKLKNNLNLEVLGPGGLIRYVGNSFNSARTTAREFPASETAPPFDNRNNVECVILDPVEAGSVFTGPKDISGTYTVRVIAKKVIYPEPTAAKQPYALVVSALGLTKGPITGRLGQRLAVDNAEGELNTQVALTATLSGTPVPNGVPVTFAVAGQSKTVNTVNGVAAWADFTPTGKGAFTIDCVFAGQGGYLPATGTGRLLVKAPGTRFTNLNPVTGQFAQNVTVSATLVKESDSTLLNGKTVRFDYAGQHASALMTGGVATVTFPCTETGTASCWFDGDDDYEDCSGSIPVNPTPVIGGIAVLDVAATYGDSEQIKAIFGTFPNQPNSGAALNFLITPLSTPARNVGRRRTDPNGFAAATFTVLEEPGTYPITVRDEVDPLSGRFTLSGNASLTVTKANGSLWIDTNWAQCYEPVIIVATLLPTTPGHAVKLTVGSDTKSLVTAANGTVQWTVGPFTEETKLRVKAEFAGNTYINACPGVERELTVRKRAGRLDVSNVAVKANVKPILGATLTPPAKGKSVKLKVGDNGTWATGLTADGGTVTVEYPAIATAGDYHIQVEFAGDNGIAAAYGAGVLKVKP